MQLMQLSHIACTHRMLTALPMLHAFSGRGRADFSEHVRHKWLLHLEGISASSRLGQLMTMNSLVLRAMESNMSEHYYRALRPWVHYVPFFEKHRSGED